MPIGSYHELSGILLCGPTHPVLRVDDGGEWRLDVTKAVVKLYGRRVIVTGTRGDFDIIDAKSIRPTP